MKNQSFFDSLFPTPHVLAINHTTTTDAPARAIAFGTAINVAPIDEASDEWVQISPYGEFRNELGLQIFNRERADQIVTAFNSIVGRLGRLFRGVPIYRGHPIQRPDIWPDDRRYGRLNAVEARDDGLYGKPAWNSLGRENLQEGFFVYPSPGWHFDQLGNGRIAPVQLDHVGLTNSPNIAAVAPITNSTLSAAPAEHQQTTTTKENHMDRKLLIAALGLNAEATDEQITTAINSLRSERDVATNAEKNPLVVAANADAKKFKKLAIAQQLDVAVNDGRITAADRAAWESKFEANFDATATELKDKQPALNTKSLELQPSGADLSDASKRRIAFNARIDELTLPAERGGKGMSLNAAINFMRGNKDDAALLKAMEEPTAAGATA